MADDEQFSLCWNNFNTNLSAGFHDSLCRGDLVDVTLAAEGQLVKAHRLVLSVCSPYFRKMFTQMPANQHAFVFLKDVSHSALKDLIQFMYCGEVNVKQDALPAFISTAEALQIKGLTETGEGSSAPPHQSPAKEGPSVPSASPRSKQQTRARVQSYKVESEESSDEKVVQVQTQKRTLQRSITPQVTPVTKRAKITADPLESSDPPTVQTVHVVKQQVQQPLQSSEPEYVEMPMETINPKSEPEYVEDTSEIEAAEQEHDQDTETHELQEQDDTTYVEDESYGDIKYDESYFNENDEAKAGVSGFSESYTEGGDQSASEAQASKVNTVDEFIISDLDEMKVPMTLLQQFHNNPSDEMHNSENGNIVYINVPERMDPSTSQHQSFSSYQMPQQEQDYLAPLTDYSEDIKLFIKQIKMKFPRLYQSKLVKNAKLKPEEYQAVLREITILFTNKYSCYPKPYEKTRFARIALEAFPSFGEAETPCLLNGIRSPKWAYIYWEDNPHGASGKLDNILTNLRRKLPPQQKKNNSRHKQKLMHIEMMDRDKKELAKLKSLDPSIQQNKPKIFALMERLHPFRKQLTYGKSNQSAKYILDNYPQMCDFQGDLILKDFTMSFPNVTGSFAKFETVIDRMDFEMSDEWEEIENNTIRALLNVSSFLGHRGLKRDLTKDKTQHKNKGDEEHRESQKEQVAAEFIVWVPIDEDVQRLVTSKAGIMAHNKHPFLVCQSPAKFKDGYYFVVIDEKVIPMGTNADKACDLLYKAFQVFNLEYPPFYRKMFVFLGAYAYSHGKTKEYVSVQNLIIKLKKYAKMEVERERDLESELNSEESDTDDSVQLI